MKEVDKSGAIMLFIVLTAFVLLIVGAWNGNYTTYEKRGLGLKNIFEWVWYD